MTEMLTTGSQEFRLLGETLIQSTSPAADKGITFMIVGSSTGLTLPEMRERVQKTDTKFRANIVREFVKRVTPIAFVREVWLDEHGREAVVHVIVEDASLDRELELEAVFTSVLTDKPRFDGYLHVHSAEEADGDFGTRLFSE